MGFFFFLNCSSWIDFSVIGHRTMAMTSNKIPKNKNKYDLCAPMEHSVHDTTDEK